MVVIESENVNQFLLNQIKFKQPESAQGFWIGMRSVGDVEAKLTWLDTDQFWMPQKFEESMDTKRKFKVSLPQICFVIQITNLTLSNC